MPLLHMYPDADIPVIEISLPMTMSAQEIYKIGQTLAPLRDKQILLIGSGSITHNLRELAWNGRAVAVPEWRLHSVILWSISSLIKILMQFSIGKISRLYNATIRPLNTLHLIFFAMGAGPRFSIVHSSF